MNGSPEFTGGIPVNSLAGLASLSNVLTELPLPQAIPETLPWNKSLLFHPKVVEEAQRYLSCNDETLIAQLVSVLSLTNVDNLEFKDSSSNNNTQLTSNEGMPDLIKAVYARDPLVFHGGTKQQPQQQPFQNSHFSQAQAQNHASRLAVSQSTNNLASSPAGPNSVQSAQGSSTPDISARDLENDCRPSTSKVTSHHSSEQREAMRKQIISIGKQPKGGGGGGGGGGGRKKKDMVSELFDSLTPDAAYFDADVRRRRVQPKTYTEEEYEKPKLTAADDTMDSDELKTPSKRKGKRHESEDDILPDRPVTPTEVLEERERQWQQILKKRKEKMKKRSEQIMLDPDELMETETYRKFTEAVDAVFENIEEYATPADTVDDDQEVPAECLIPRSVLSDLCGETQKLKIMRAVNKVPIERLVRLLTILEKNIKDGAKLTPSTDDGSDDETFRELISDRIIRSVDAAIAALTVMTSPAMPKQVYIEDTIERSILLTKFQLANVVYPAFDPVYRVSKKETPAKTKRGKSTVKNKSMIQIYNKIVEVVGGLAELVEIQSLTDTVILQLSTLGVAPFFVENISELQLNALRLVANIFNKYRQHRQHILDDILSSLARLPSTKRGMRTYRLNANEYIQMVTALVMQLIQSVVILPTSRSDDVDDDEAELILTAESRTVTKTLGQGTADQDKDVLIQTSYDSAMRTANMFLSVYLKKCTTKSEEDYRPLFEAFVEDLLAAVNKPEWPAAEVLLSLLGRLLVQHFSSKQIDMSLRVASLDYLGVVAARLRKDAVSSQVDDTTLNQVIQELTSYDEEAGNSNFKTGKKRKHKDKLQVLQRGLNDYLVEAKENDPSLEFARQFYIAQWFRDSTSELDRKKQQQKQKSKIPDLEDCADSDGEEHADEKALEKANFCKQFLSTLIDRDGEMTPYASSKQSFENKLSEENALFVVRYLATRRPFAQSFDIYLNQIIRVLNEPAVAVRTKAMKCLSSVVEADPAILEKADVQHSVYARLRDQSANVREAAVDLLGKFILVRTNLVSKYYSMLAERILDKGVSVRKRVIKILKDICVELPDYEKVPEICLKILGRIEEKEEGVRKSVVEVFHGLWFTPVRDRDTALLYKKVITITDVIALSRDVYEWFEMMLSTLLKKDVDKQVLTASKQMVKCLVETVLTLEEKLIGNGAAKSAGHNRLLACLATLYLFSKVKPSLMVPHIETMQPYLSMNCNTQGEQSILVNVVRILEMVIPLMDHPSETFLARIEEGVLKLAFKCGQQVVQACVACLAATIKKLTQNFKLVFDAFYKFFHVMIKIKNDVVSSGVLTQNLKPSLLRSLFTVGLLCRHFNFDAQLTFEKAPAVPFAEQTFATFLMFASYKEEDVQLKALLGLGFFCVNHCDYLMKKEVKQLYHNILEDSGCNVKLKVQVLQNIELYLREEDTHQSKMHEEYMTAKAEGKDDLKELGDVSSGMSSTIIQLYLTQCLESFFNANAAVRTAAANVAMLTLQQGLVHPVQCIPYLIAMGTENDRNIRHRADNMLKEIDSKYVGFIQMGAVAGIKKSYALQRLLQMDDTVPVRGLRIDEETQAQNAFLYSVIRSNKQQRRGLLQSLLKLFDESSKTSMEELIYVADLLASFPYQIQEEPLYVVHNIDLNVAVYGSNLLQSFKEALHPKQDNLGGQPEQYDDEDDTADEVFARLPESLTVQEDCIAASQGCVLLLQVKNFLKELYGFTDGKVHAYNPSEAQKAYEKPLNRKQDPNLKFEPRFALQYLTVDLREHLSDEEHRRKLCRQYVDFKQLFLSIDASSQSDDEGAASADSPPVVVVAAASSKALTADEYLDNQSTFAAGFHEYSSGYPQILTNQIQAPQQYYGHDQYQGRGQYPEAPMPIAQAYYDPRFQPMVSVSRWAGPMPTGNQSIFLDPSSMAQYGMAPQAQASSYYVQQQHEQQQYYQQQQQQVNVGNHYYSGPSVSVGNSAMAGSHRESAKMKSDNMYNDVLRPKKVTGGGAYASVLDGGGGRTKKRGGAGGKTPKQKTRKRKRRTGYGSGSDSGDASDDTDYVE